MASWITFVLGKGIQEGSATASLVDESGESQPLRLRYTRWGGTSRVVRFQPLADLVPGATYTVTLDAGATLVDGSQTLLAHQQSICRERSAELISSRVVARAALGGRGCCHRGERHHLGLAVGGSAGVG